MAWFTESVDKIIGHFDYVKDRLNTHAEAKAQEEDFHLDKVEDHKAQAESARKEADRATSIARKIEELLK